MSKDEEDHLTGCLVLLLGRPVKQGVLENGIHHEHEGFSIAPHAGQHLFTACLESPVHSRQPQCSLLVKINLLLVITQPQAFVPEYSLGEKLSASEALALLRERLYGLIDWGGRLMQQWLYKDHRMHVRTANTRES